jgi:hypothetical protein
MSAAEEFTPSAGPSSQDDTGGIAAPVAARRLVVWLPDQVPEAQDAIGPGDLQNDTVCRRLLLRSLMRAQLALSLVCLVAALAVTVSFPLVAALAPGTGRVMVAGLPLTLIVLGAGVYPILLAVGWFYNRQARQLEVNFTKLVDPKDRRFDG